MAKKKSLVKQVNVISPQTEEQGIYAVHDFDNKHLRFLVSKILLFLGDMAI